MSGLIRFGFRATSDFHHWMRASSDDDKLSSMNTLSGDSSKIWADLAMIWPELDWSRATFHHGAFHHVAVFGRSTVIRASSAADHRERIVREHRILNVFDTADLPFRFPSILTDPVTSSTWSALACSFIPGSSRQTLSWAQARDPLAWMPKAIREMRVERGILPPVRQWCGGAGWPALVERITAPHERSIRDAALNIVHDVLQAESSCETAVVHGDFGLHNVLWDMDHKPGLIDFDNACVGDPAIDIAPLIGIFGSTRVSDITDTETLERARIHRASLPLQVAAAAELAGDVKLKNHALSNFITRHHANSLYNPQP